MNYSDEKFYLEHGKKCLSLRTSIESIADRVCDKGITSIFFVGAGSSLQMGDAFRHFFQQLSDVPVYSIESAELSTCGFYHLKKGALVILVTLTGTPEAVEAAEYCHKNEIDLVAFLGTENSPIYELANHVICSDEPLVALRYIMLFFLIFRMLHRMGSFPQYERFIHDLEKLPEALFEAGKEFKEAGLRLAEQCAKEDFILWISSGAAYGETFSFANCCVEEMIWKKTQTMQSAEFFHGCFEIVDKDLCVVLVKNEDGNRALEERVEQFLQRFGKKYFVVDPTKAKLTGISPEFRRYVLPAVINIAFHCGAQEHLEELTGRSAKTRRYYNVVSY